MFESRCARELARPPCNATSWALTVLRNRRTATLKIIGSKKTTNLQGRRRSDKAAHFSPSHPLTFVNGFLNLLGDRELTHDSDHHVATNRRINNDDVPLCCLWRDELPGLDASHEGEGTHVREVQGCARPQRSSAGS